MQSSPLSNPRGLFMLLLLRRLSIVLNRYRGLRIVSEWLRKRFTHSILRITINDFDGDGKFICDLGEHMGNQIFWREYYSRDQIKLLAHLLRDDMVVVDVGANQGEIAIFCARKLPRGTVLAFEPTSQMHTRLVQNIQLNQLTNVVAIHGGLGERKETVPIYTNTHRVEDGSVHAGLHTLHRSATRAELIEQVEIETLDHYLETHAQPRIDLIKIDVEGAELAVLKGAEQTIAKHRPVIVLELAPETAHAAGHTLADLVNTVQRHAYRIETILSDGTTRPIQPRDLSRYQNVVCYPTKS